MQQIVVVRWCDWPDCEGRGQSPGGQTTREIEFWVYTPGRGRKSRPIRVEVCEEHEARLKSLYSAMAKYNMKRDQDREPEHSDA